MYNRFSYYLNNNNKLHLMAYVGTYVPVGVFMHTQTD